MNKANFLKLSTLFIVYILIKIQIIYYIFVITFFQAKTPNWEQNNNASVKSANSSSPSWTN